LSVEHQQSIKSGRQEPSIQPHWAESRDAL